MKKLFKWPLIVVMIIVIAVVLYLVWIAVFDTKWLDLKRETYENSRYNFSLKYPENWILGETEINNAGRELYSPDKEVFCYAYGFANTLINDETGEPQTLDEFIDWLTNKGNFSDIKDVLQRDSSTLSGKKAIKLLIEQETTYKEAIYAMEKETGIGFFCIYPDMETISKYADEFNQIVNSFKIKADLDGETAKMGTDNCINLLNGAINPLKDLVVLLTLQQRGLHFSRLKYNK